MWPKLDQPDCLLEYRCISKTTYRIAEYFDGVKFDGFDGCMVALFLSMFISGVRKQNAEPVQGVYS